MSIQLKRWQTQIDISDEEAVDNIDERPIHELIYIYGETIDQLRQATRAYLLARKPRSFSSIGDHIVGESEYYDSKVTNNDLKEEEEEWLRCDLELVRGIRRKIDFINSPEKMESFEEAVEHFVTMRLIPEKGPSYKSKAIVGHDIQLPLLACVIRETEEHPIHDLIQRGWHLIALEYKGELSSTGELANRTAVFVMGHPEEQAARLTLDSYYYRSKGMMTQEEEELLYSKKRH